MDRMGFVFWDITPYSLAKVTQRFRGTCCLRLQGRRVSQVNNHEAGREALLVCSVTVARIFAHLNQSQHSCIIQLLL
jgi:hypothetical protein